MDQNNNIQKAKPVPPFVRYCSAIIPTMFDDSLSYYEALCALNNFIQKNLVEVINNNANVTEEYIRLTNELKEYVENYFKNLDVQEEINNKLDQMAVDGSLTQIIAQFLGLGALAVFDTKADMIASEHLIKGSKVQTLGKTTKNDGYGAYYTIDETGDIELANGLYATLVPNFGGDNYIEDITIEYGRSNETDWYIATIPVNDSEGNLITPYVAKDEDSTPLTYAEKNNTTLTVNAGLTLKDETAPYAWKQAIVIGNGEVLNTYEPDHAPESYMRYIGFKADRTIVDFPAVGTTAEIMLAQGVVNAYLVFNKSIDNGVINIPEEFADSTDTSQRLDIGVKLDGTILILASDGRTNSNVGLTMQEAAELLLSKGCVNAWRTDGGGSTSMSYKGSKINRNWDNEGSEDRKIKFTLNFKTKTIDEQLARAYSFFSEQKQLLNKQIRKDLGIADSYYGTGWSANINKCTEDNQIIRIQTQDGYRHGEMIQRAVDSDTNRTNGFVVNGKGLIEYEATVLVGTSSASAIRRLRLMKVGSPDTEVSYSSVMPVTIKPTSTGEYHEIVFKVVFNNREIGNEYYLEARGMTNDDFSRINFTAKYLGTVA